MPRSAAQPPNGHDAARPNPPFAGRSEGTISGAILLRIVTFATARGHDADALCRSVGLRREALQDPNSRFPYGVALTLGNRTAEVTGDPNIGLHMAQSIGDPTAYDAGILLLMASPNIRVALMRATEHQRYWGDGERYRLVPVAAGLSVRYAFPASGQVDRRHIDECAMAELALGLRALAGAQLVPRVVRFRHLAPADVTEHEAIFRCPMEFGAADTEIEFDDAALDAPMTHANEAYAAIFETQVKQALARLPGASGLADDVRAVARAVLAGGKCTLEGTASILGVSVRTLQRKLHAEGTSFGELVDAVRLELATAYLDKGLPVQEIAWLLGFSDASAFHHAFKRWTGRTPAQGRSGA